MGLCRRTATARCLSSSSQGGGNLSLNGYGYFGTSELTWDIGIFGERKVAGKTAAKCVSLSEAEKSADEQGVNARLAR